MSSKRTPGPAHGAPRDQKRATLFGLVTVLLWSTVASAFKLSLEHMAPAELLLWSSAFSLATLTLILAARGRIGLALRAPVRDHKRAALYGFLNPFLYYLILFKAYDLLPAQEAQPLNYTWAIALALLSVPMLGQKLTRRDLLATLVSYLGVMVISTRGDFTHLRFESPLGVALALSSTVIWALYWILSARDERDPVAGLWLNFAYGLAYVLAWNLAFADPFAVPAAGVLGAAYVGVFEMGVTFVTWLTALKLAESAAKVGNLIFLSPFVSLVIIHFTLGETILPSTLAGLALIMGGLAIQRLARAAG